MMAEEHSKSTSADPAQDMAAKRQLNEKADAMNRIEIIRGRPVLTCGAKKRKGKPGFCKSHAGAGTQHPGYGRCKFCFGNATGPRTPEGKAAVSQNARKHGLYAEALSPAEREVYQESIETKALDLQHEIYMLKAKITVYLRSWRVKWQSYYDRKKSELHVRYRCLNPDCAATIVRGSLDSKPGYCLTCHKEKLTEEARWYANRTAEQAEAYADDQTRVWYSEGEGARSYYNAGSLNDRTLDRALNTLSRLVEKHARLNPDAGNDLLGQINAELRQASKGKVSISWSGGAQQRIDPVTEGGEANVGT